MGKFVALLCGLMLLISGCGAPEERTPAPTPEAINVIFPPALKFWADRIAACASDNPMISIYYTESPTLESTLDMNHVVLLIGAPPQTEDHPYLSQIGVEHIIVIVNSTNTLAEVSSSMLQSIYTGQIKTWDNLSGEAIQVWVLPDGDPARSYFDGSVLQTNSITSEAMLAPDPEAMLEAVSNQANAIGYIPGSLLTLQNQNQSSKVKVLQLEPTLQNGLSQPIIAMTQNEPEGYLRELLVCAQNAK